MCVFEACMFSGRECILGTFQPKAKIICKRSECAQPKAGTQKIQFTNNGNYYDCY